MLACSTNNQTSYDNPLSYVYTLFAKYLLKRVFCCKFSKEVEKMKSSEYLTPSAYPPYSYRRIAFCYAFCDSIFIFSYIKCDLLAGTTMCVLSLTEFTENIWNAYVRTLLYPKCVANLIGKLTYLCKYFENAMTRFPVIIKPINVTLFSLWNQLSEKL